MFQTLITPRCAVCLLILLIWLDLAANQVSNKDEFCTELTSKHHPQLSNVSDKLICQNLAHNCWRETFYAVLFSNHPCHQVSWASPTHLYCANCFRVLSSNDERAKWGEKISSRNLSSGTLLSSYACKLEYPPARYVDIVFLVEHSGSVDQTKMHHLMAAVQSLTEHVQNYGFDIEVHFAIVVYQLKKTRSKFIFINDFTRASLLKTVLKKVEDRMTKNELADEYIHELHPKVLHHTAVQRSLEVTSTILQQRNDGEDLPGESLSYRPNADLHVVTISNLHTKHTQSQKDASRVSKMADRVEELKADIEEEISYMIDNTDSFFSSPTSLHFFFSRSNTAAKSYLGDPALSVRYDDCSHFNKALTIKALIAASSGSNNHQDNSLQAHMLSKGVHMQVYVLSDLAKRNCILGISPSLSTPNTLRPTFSDKCLTNYTHIGQTDFYCSPLHGWSKRDQNGGNLKAALFKGKAPLTGEFATTHADLAKSAEVQKQDDPLPTETLSIINDLDTCKHQQQPTHKPFVSGSPRILQWGPSKPFVNKIIAGKEPIVLRNTVVQSWPAMKKWNFSYIAENIGSDVLSSVKCTNSYVTFDPDRRTPLKLNITLSFVETNMTKDMFFECVRVSGEDGEGKGVCPDGFKGHYYFGAVPEALKDDVMPDKYLYNTEKDYESNRQFMWISSAGMITHTHFDQDYNFFVQLIGKKRFTLWRSSQHELMYMFPRVHPMWHKSRVNYRAVDLFEFPAFSQTKALQIELGPGDMLHVPPYVWHYVETLTPSVSLSTWSHDYNLYDHMNSIYRHDHKFDLLEDPRGQMFVLRLYLDMMIHGLYGYNQTTQFFARLLTNRFSGLEHLFPPSEDDPEICSANEPGKIPTCVHVHGYAKLDMEVIGGHFEALEPAVMDILFQDYVEEITAQVVGIKKMLAFFRYCFLGQEYYITDIEDEEHLLWEHKEVVEEEELEDELLAERYND